MDDFDEEGMSVDSKRARIVEIIRCHGLSLGEACILTGLKKTTILRWIKHFDEGKIRTWDGSADNNSSLASRNCRQQKGESVGTIKVELERALSDAFEQMLSTLKKELACSVSQIESFIAVQNYLERGVLLPKFHGWPVSPDFADLLIRLVEKNVYSGIIEFGTGSSTVVLAKAALTVNGQDRSCKIPFVSIDHSEHYKEVTGKLLERNGLSSGCRLVHSPLINIGESGGSAYKYYNVEKELARFRDFDGVSSGRLLVVVDGPPALTCLHARYPALKVLLGVFGEHGKMDIVLDDYGRIEEKEIVEMWEKELDSGQVQYKKVELLDLEKQCCILRVN